MKEELSETIDKYFQNVIKNSWTWKRLTEEEKERFLDIDTTFNRIKGDKDTREQWLFTIYVGFLAGVGYDGIKWRESEKEKTDVPLF